MCLINRINNSHHPKHSHPKGPGGGGVALRLTDPATFIMARMSRYFLNAYVCGIIIHPTPLSCGFSACFRKMHVERSLPRLI
jgi:hypothetical protein